MRTILIILLAFNAGFLAYPIYHMWVHKRLYIVGYYLYIVAGVVVDLGCQLWLDITRIFRRKTSSNRSTV